MFEKHKQFHLSKMQIIALGFIGVILTGTLLLMLPISSKTGEFSGFLDCLFTAVSSTCVTGLIVVDTYVHWSLFGQLVIITMIQIGGLGFMTFGVLFAMILHKRIGLKERDLMSESISALHIGGIVGLARKIIFGTLIIEGTGAVLLSIRFIPQFGWVRGIYYGIFHSISAFCNAGFDLMGINEEYSSLVAYSGDWLVSLTIMLLIVVGGIGFLVWEDVYKNKWHVRKYRLHTKIVLTTTLVLIFAGAILFSVFEKHNLQADMGWGETFLTSMFASITPRTAGFNTIDVGAMTPSSKLLTVILMFIGGSPGSTAGGIKTTTLVVFLLYMRAGMLRTRGCNIFHRRIDGEAIKKASSILFTNLTLILGSVLFICASQALPMEDVLLEVTSAMGTVGMSTGITRELLPVCRIVICILMYCGRIGSLAFALSFTARRKTSPLELPEEKILVG